MALNGRLPGLWLRMVPAIQSSLQVVVADFSPEGGGADAELQRSLFTISVIFAKTRYQKIAVDVVAFRDVRKEGRWSGRFRVRGGSR